MKRIFSLFLALLPCLFLFGCTPQAPEEGGLQIVATLFPQYDFAREICGNKATISLLLPPGMDSHSFAPSPQDVLALHRADLVLYTGDGMEPWAKELMADIPGKAVDVSRGALLLAGDHIHETKKTETADHLADPHIWTNPQNAVIMAQNICRAICERDAENADFYSENAKAYIEKLCALDTAIAEAVDAAPHKKIFFGGHFAMRYFTHRYELSYVSAFDACSGETEATPSTLMEMITEMKAEKIPAVYYEELSTPRTAMLLARETGAKPLLLHSCHNLSAEEQDETYLSLMYKNLENLKIGLGAYL